MGGSSQMGSVLSNTYYLVAEDGSLSEEGASSSNFNVYYDEQSNKLTINNLQIASNKWLLVPGGVTIEVTGNNKIDMSGTSGGSIATVSDGGMTLEGNGSLHIRSHDFAGITMGYKGNSYNGGGSASGGVTIGGSINLTVDHFGAASCISASRGEDVVIGGSAKVTLNPSEGTDQDNASIINFGGGNITIGDAAEVTSAGSLDTTGQNSDGSYGTVSVEGTSSLTVTDQSDSGVALRGEGGVTVAKGATLEVSCNSKMGQGIVASDGPIDIFGKASVTMTNQNPLGNAALYAQDMLITGSLSVKGGVNGLYLRGSNPIVFDGADVKISDCYLAVPFPADITNSLIEVDAGGKAFSNKPVVKLDNGYELHAGASKNQAKYVPLDEATLGTWQNKYVRVSKHAHAFNQEVASSGYLASAATCTEPAEYYYSCVCGAKGTSTFVSGNPLGHSLTETEKVEPTCTAAGKEAYYTCDRCNKRFEDADAQTEIADLDGYGVIAPTGHQLERVSAKEPTATEPGNIEYWVCSACGKLFTDEGATVETTLDKTVIPATGEEPVERFTVTLVYGNGQPDGKFEIAKGERLVRPADPEPVEGYEFAGWFTVKNADNTLTGAYDFNEPVTSDLTIYAGWIPADSGAEKPSESEGSADKAVRTLPQTGDASALPVACVAGAGVVCLVAGVAMLRRRRE